MKKTLLSSLLLVFAVPLLAVGLLPAPESFNAYIADNILYTSWDPVASATKYSVNVVASYDLNGDGTAEMSVDYDFGTSDRTDGALISDPYLNIPLEELVLWIDYDEDGAQDEDELFEPVSIKARVKALNPGKLKGRQDNPFCVFDDDMSK